MKKKPPPTMTETLREAIVAREIPLLRLEQLTGVPRMSLSRFVRGTRSLRLDVADKLAAYFDLELRKRG
jgi:plasmid maintenance system antidote protein VapI